MERKAMILNRNKCKKFVTNFLQKLNTFSVVTLVIALLVLSSFFFAQKNYEEKFFLKDKASYLGSSCFYGESFDSNQNNECLEGLANFSKLLDASKKSTEKDAFLWQLALESQNFLRNSIFFNADGRQDALDAARERLQLFYPVFSKNMKVDSVKSLKSLFLNSLNS
jgi:hypothetical protein